MRITEGYLDRKNGQWDSVKVEVRSEEQGAKKPNGWRGVSKAESGRGLL